MLNMPRPFRRPVALTVLCLAALGGAAPSPAFAQKKAPAPRPGAKPAAALAVKPVAVPSVSESYYGVYIQNAKVGSMVLKKTDGALYKGKPAVRYESRTNLELEVLGTATQVSSTSVSWSDPKTGQPLAVQSQSESAGRKSSVTATYTKDSVSYVADVTGSIQKKTLPLKAGETWLVDPTNGANVTPRVGMKFKGKVFIPEPALLQLMDSEIEILSRDTITVNGQAVVAYKVVDRNPIAPATSYVNEAGDLLRTETLMGMQMRREPKEMALAKGGAKPDLLALVGLKPSGLPLEKPRTLRSVKYELTPVTRDLPPADNIQSVTYAPGAAAGDARSAVVSVTTRPLPEGPTVPLFARKEDAPANLRDYLGATLYVQSDDPAFRKLAKEVVGGETDAAKAAAKISAYVHGLMKADPTISNFRSSLDILKEPKGVCRDYTLLFTTLARAAGLATKQCVGVAYANGIFVGHAWPEVWVGNDTWIALEPTWGVPFADATHLKLSEGEITDFYKVAADLSNYKIKVLSAE